MIIVYGGSFNPPTKAHQKIMVSLIDKYKPDKFIFLPVGNSYKKPELIAFSKRVDMLELISKDYPEVIVSSIEDEAAYKGTLDALDKISAIYQSEVSFVIGGDNILSLEKWINANTLIKKHKIIVIDRGGINIDEIIHSKFPKDKNQFEIVNLTLVESSSKVRSHFYQYEDYVSAEVSQYIKKNHLYGV